MSAKLVTPWWSTRSLNKDTNSYSKIHSLHFTLLWKNLAPCFHHSGLKVDGDCGSTLYFFICSSQFPLISLMSDGSEDSVNNATIKVPPFFKHSLDTWFGHLEAQFDIRKITISSTKFYWCISALPSDISTQLTHLIQDPGDDSYQDICNALMHGRE